MPRYLTLSMHVLLLVAVALIVTAGQTSAHARYDRSEPPAGGSVEVGQFVLKAWFTQELMSASSILVRDEAGTRVDLADGRVDLDDPNRKVMLVSLPELPVGVYHVTWTTHSAEDGDEETGTFTFGVGVTPPAAFSEAPVAAAKAACQAAQ